MAEVRKCPSDLSPAMGWLEILLPQPSRKSRFSDHGLRLVGHHLERGSVMLPRDLSNGLGSMENFDKASVWQVAR